MKRDAVLFYKSFEEAISMLPDEDQLKAYRAIIRYGLYGEEPNVDGVAGAVYLLAKPQIDANNRRYENGKRGGRPKRTETDPVDNQKITEIKPNVNQNTTNVKAKDKDKDKDKVKDNKHTVRSSAQIESVFETVWKAYPEKKGKGRVSDKDKRKIAEIGSDKILAAINRYKDEVDRSGWKHYQNGSTFFHSGYLDYLDENYEPSKQRDRSLRMFNNAPARNYDMDELERKLLATN